MANQDADKDDTDIPLKVRPTVFVALGGTGMEVLLRLRRRILQADWNGARLNAIDEFPAASFLYFDTDTVSARETGRSAQTDPLAAKVAFSEGEALQKAVNLARYQAERKSYPQIDEWLPSQDLARIDSSKGAGQVRCISRLLFFDEYKTLMARMTGKANAVLSNMSNEARLRAVGLDTNTDLRVVVVGSVAGGTGSGTFLDVGYAISSMETPKRASAVELFLVLPSGYIGANRERVFANGFAALSELEYAMRGRPSPAYVSRWTDYDVPSRYVERPYSEVYLFDTHNLADQKTSNITDLYDMMADILFEDFGNSEFSGRKRSIGVNQTQHKMRKWAPPTSAEIGPGAMMYSQNYSAMGQAIIATLGSLEFEATTVEAGIEMVEAFFGVARGDEIRNIPSVEERERFLADKLDLRFSAFDEFSKVLQPAPQAIREYGLVDILLQRENSTSIQESIAVGIEEEIESIKTEIEDLRNWSTNVRKVADKLQVDILGRTGSGATYGARGVEVQEVRARLEAALLTEDGPRSLRAELYKLLDDQQRGGLEYALALIEQVKDALGSDDGAVARLNQAAADYGRIADEVLSEHFTASLARLDQVKPGLIFSGRKDGEKYLDQARADLRDFAVLRIRAVAAREAAALLTRVAARLGNRIGADERKGRSRHDGIRGEFEQGRSDVERLVGDLRLDLGQIESAIGRASGGTFLVLRSGSLPPVPTDPAKSDRDGNRRTERLGWAREVFKAYGGSRAIFRILREDEDRSKLLNAVLAMSKRQHGTLQADIPSAAEALRAMKPGQQREMLATMLARSMPWMFASFDAFKPIADQYKMIVAVEGAREFERDFGAIVRSELPAVFGGGGVSYFESGARGRIVCYCELSGVPLDVLAPLRRDWRTSYEQELNRPEAIPLHNHKDYLRFPDPVVPTSEEIERLRDTLSLFIRGFCLGVFRRDADSGLYRFEFERGDWRSIGSERTLRRKLFDPAQSHAIVARVMREETALEPVQVLAAAALFEWTARRAYAPRRETVNFDAESRVGGLAHHAALGLARQWRLNAQTMPGIAALPGGPDEAMRRLLETIEQWSVPIPGSLADVDGNEANRDPQDQPALRAVDKRTVVPARFTAEALLALLGGGESQAQPAAPQPAPSSIPMPPTQRGFFLFLQQQVTGPIPLAQVEAMIRSGAVTAGTQVHPEGGNWMPAGDHLDLAGAFRRPAPPSAGMPLPPT